MIEVQNLFTGEVEKLYGVWPISRGSDVFTSLEHSAPKTNDILKFVGTDEMMWRNFKILHPYRFIPNRKQ